MHIYEYLCRRAREISDSAPQALTTPEEWRDQRSHRVKLLYEMMGLSDLMTTADRPPPHATVTSSVNRDGYRIENLYFQSLPRLYIAANLYVPANETRVPMPAVLYLCGHSDFPRGHYQAHLRRFARLGFVALVIDTINVGEIGGYHHGTFYEGWWHWYSRGYTPAGVELYNAIRAIDFLESLSFVDPTRIGVTGISGGGATSWWLAATDERVGCAAPVCASGTFASQILDRTIDGQCDCMFPINTYGWDMVDVAALVAPRPCLIASADSDRIFTIASAREFYHRLERVYKMLGAEHELTFVETGGRHSYSKISRAAIFSWFLKHLAGRVVDPAEVGEFDPENNEPEEVLRVFADSLPNDEITTTIHDSFVRVSNPPAITDEKTLIRHRDHVVAELRTKTFAHFPSEPADLDSRLEFNWSLEDQHGTCISFVVEEDLRLWLNITIPNDSNGPRPAVVALQNSGERQFGTTFFSEPSCDYVQASLETRGTGRTSWAQELQWHLRRAAMLTGRTIASMRVWDTLRTLAAVRQLTDVDASRIALAGSGEMAAVVLYAALLDGNVSSVLLHRPPATQDSPGHKHGLGDSIEMLNCLRVTDLPQVAGLLFPAELVFVGPRPSTYIWAEQLYARFGGRVCHVRKLELWDGAMLQDPQ
jgi:cephalosporin-C deacetylase-like acetyl esterase